MLPLALLLLPFLLLLQILLQILLQMLLTLLPLEVARPGTRYGVGRP